MVLIAFTGLLIAQETAVKKPERALMVNASFAIDGRTTFGGGVFNGTGTNYLLFGFGPGINIEEEKEVKIFGYIGGGLRVNQVLIDFSYVKGISEARKKVVSGSVTKTEVTAGYPDGVRFGIAYVIDNIVVGIGFGNLNALYGNVGIVF